MISSSFFTTAKFLSRAGLSLHEVQCHLDCEGASDLVIELVVNSVTSPSIFEEAVTLGIALLEGGNPIIQKSMYKKLVAGDLSHAFFKVRILKLNNLILNLGRNSNFKVFIIFFLQVFYDKMRDAQQEIRSTVTVNTSDIAVKAHEDKDVTKEIERIAYRKSESI